MAFLPISVIFVSLILNRAISIREKSEKIERLNILINDFFTEAGSEMIGTCNRFIVNLEEIKPAVKITAQWTEADFNAAVSRLEKADIQADIRMQDIAGLKALLLEKKKNILAMVENPSLLEHDRFTDMLWAVYHMEEELKAREDFSTLPKADIEHLRIDLERAYRLLIIEWLYFNQYIKRKYPYLFSFALRKSPFCQNSVIIRD